MDNSATDNLFVTTDPRGKSISLSRTRYFEHIISSDQNHQAHPEFTPDEVKATIEKPDVIYASTYPDSDVYFKKGCTQYPKLFLKVAVALYENETIGTVETAFLSKSISGNINEKELKYVKPRL